MILIVQNDPAVPAGRFARLLDDWQVPWKIWRPDLGQAPPEFAALKGAIVLGGYMGVHDQARYPYLATVKTFMADLLTRDIPQLGICLGGQLLAAVLGGEVRAGVGGERGCRSLLLTAAGQTDPLFAGLPPAFAVFQWHHDSFAVPPGAVHLAHSAVCPGQVIRAGRAWGAQFHPEVTPEIVAPWQLRTGAPAEVVAEFREREEELAISAVRLLRNFLALSGVATVS